MQCTDKHICRDPDVLLPIRLREGGLRQDAACQAALRQSPLDLLRPLPRGVHGAEPVRVRVGLAIKWRLALLGDGEVDQQDGDGRLLPELAHQEWQQRAVLDEDEVLPPILRGHGDDILEGVVPGADVDWARRSIGRERLTASHQDVPAVAHLQEGLAHTAAADDHRRRVRPRGLHDPGCGAHGHGRVGLPALRGPSTLHRGSRSGRDGCGRDGRTSSGSPRGRRRGSGG
mmetsp:Transcript_61249/g.192841  ORF Transcript_61249/g.192841 Transcript_61249/m.192841 type:complete len:230 (-) Transcript_61249:194-883(-)